MESDVAGVETRLTTAYGSAYDASISSINPQGKVILKAPIVTIYTGKGRTSPGQAGLDGINVQLLARVEANHNQGMRGYKTK